MRGPVVPANTALPTNAARNHTSTNHIPTTVHHPESATPTTAPLDPTDRFSVNQSYYAERTFPGVVTEFVDEASRAVANPPQVPATSVSTPTVILATMTSTNDPTTVAPEPTKVAPEPTTVAPEPTTAAPEPTTSAPVTVATTTVPSPPIRLTASAPTSALVGHAFPVTVHGPAGATASVSVNGIPIGSVILSASGSGVVSATAWTKGSATVLVSSTQWTGGIPAHQSVTVSVNIVYVLAVR